MLRRVQWAGTLAAVLALIGLLVPGPANAAAPSYDQMTGVGQTASAITVPWTQGLLNASNAPIAGTAAGDSTNFDRTVTTPSTADPIAFMHQDFQNLSVTVSQTQDITHQGINVSWTWPGGPTAFGGDFVQADYLQMMECYGDAATGPTPDQCEYGSSGLLPSNDSVTQGIGERSGALCAAGSVASTANPPRAADGEPATLGCDPLESATSADIAPACTTCDANGFFVPFEPVGGDASSVDYSRDTVNYSEFNTNEVQETISDSTGSGQQQFETLTGTESPALGCGEADSGQPRGCWLVIVPRGTYEPNGYHVDSKDFPTSALGNIVTSPLSASNWDQRIQIHLSFAPVASFCPLGTPELQTVGTALVTRAMQSWQIALNQTANCASQYGFIATTETTSTTQISTDTTGGTGLAFTTIPIGAEATRGGGSPPTLPPILYAPVAISALDFGFNIDEGSGYVTKPVELTPLLVAKALTQSYLGDLPDYYPSNPADTGPAWAQKNPTNISTDPQFQKLNPNVGVDTQVPVAPLLTEDHSALNQQVWQWVQADSTASGWLQGTADATDGNMAVDPDYTALNLGLTTTVTDSYPRAYNPAGSTNGEADLGTSATGVKETRDSLDLLPYALSLDKASAAVLAANDPAPGVWDASAISPTGSLGWWDKAGVEPLGQIFMWAASDTPDLAAYGLVPAQLCDDTGSTCLSPSTTSVTAAVTNAKTDSAGLLQVNPAQPGTGAYPLVNVIYAAVPTNQSAANLTAYATLIAYAAGSGQTTGSAPGNLPPGYLPLTSSLQTQAMNVVAELRADANPSASPSASASASASQSASASSSTSSAASSGQSTSSGQSASSGSSTSSGQSASSGQSTSSGQSATSSQSKSSGQVPLVLVSPTGNSTALLTSTSGGNGNAAPTPRPGATPVPSGSLAGQATAGPTPSGDVITLPPAKQASNPTLATTIGIVRWVLIAVVILGGLCAGGAMLLSSGQLPPWMNRRVPGAWRP